MKQKRFLGLLPVLCLLAMPALAQELRLSSEVAEFNTEVDVSLTVVSQDAEIQGFVATANLDAGATIVAVNRAAALDEADTVVANVGDGSFFVLGVVMDSDPTDNEGVAEVIGPTDENGVVVATVTVACGPGPDESTHALTFTDGANAAAAGGPALDNVVVVGGLSIGETEGLVLSSGQVRCIPTPDSFSIDDQEINTAGGQIPVLLANNGEVEGFVTVVCHDPAALTLTSIDLGADAAQADFSQAEIAEGGGAFGVVIDLVDPMENPPNILPGAGHEIALYGYSVSIADRETTALSFCDGTIGSPTKDNLIVVGGLSITSAEDLVLRGGTLTAAGVRPSRETDCADGVDNDGDGDTDLDDIDCQTFDFDWSERNIPATPDGSEAELIYTAPTEEALGIGGDGGDVLNAGSPNVSTQGFSLALSYDCALIAGSETFDISGTILETLGAEFIGVQADNDGDDGDGCSLILAVLVDALPPFDGGVIPGLADSQVMGRLTFSSTEEMACGTSTTIVPADGANGNGKVPVRNLISVDNLPYRVTVAVLNVTVVASERFYRGDCNFTGRTLGLDPVEIADAAAVISHLFQRSIFKFDPPCEDACDANDDGRIDLADAIGILNYLFVPGSRFPPAPGPGFVMDMDTGGVAESGAGGDPTEDPLTCIGGTACGFQ